MKVLGGGEGRAPLLTLTGFLFSPVRGLSMNEEDRNPPVRGAIIEPGHGEYYLSDLRNIWPLLACRDPGSDHWISRAG